MREPLCSWPAQAHPRRTVRCGKKNPAPSTSTQLSSLCARWKRLLKFLPTHSTTVSYELLSTPCQTCQSEFVIHHSSKHVSHHIPPPLLSSPSLSHLARKIMRLVDDKILFIFEENSLLPLLITRREPPRMEKNLHLRTSASSDKTAGQVGPDLTSLLLLLLLSPPRP
eukprot:753448-Hanusia_phi.AAC.1